MSAPLGFGRNGRAVGAVTDDDDDDPDEENTEAQKSQVYESARPLSARRNELSYQDGMKEVEDSILKIEKYGILCLVLSFGVFNVVYWIDLYDTYYNT